MIHKPKQILKPTPFVLWIILIILIVWTYTYYSMTVFNDGLSEYHSFIVHQNALDLDGSGYLINTKGCRIPEMYIKGPDIDKYMEHRDSINCQSKWSLNLPLVTSNLTSLILNMSAWATLNISQGDPTFDCYYTPIERLNINDKQGTKGYDDNNVKLGKKIYFKNDTTVLDEMVEVKCTLNESVIYWDYHIFIRPNNASIINFNEGNVSVLVLGLDAVSRINFHRQMPKTDEFLSHIGNVEMLGYNKVEDNTFPNLIPVLSGMSVEELKNHCWPRDQYYFDNCHFVWDDFKNANFETAFIEDSPMIGVFNYLKTGFSNKPTDHYLRPIMLQSERTAGHGYCGNTLCCTGDKLTLTALLDHTYKIALSMVNNLYMNFAWSSSLTHDFVEYPYYGDEVLRRFFDKLNESGELNKTIVILMSDHGIRWGAFRDTYEGSLEDRLPMLRFILPDWFKDVYPTAVGNLNKNTVRLTTPYDLHETLSDLMDVGRLDDESIGKRVVEVDRNARGVSLFLEIHEDRTCKTAGIPVHYCACHDSRTVLAVDDARVVTAAKVLMEYINSKLESYHVCANLKLNCINNAAVNMGRDGSVKDYEIQVTTVPGFAKFEATVREDHGNFRMVGSVSRLNLYGSQSICVNDTKIKLLCYCTH